MILSELIGELVKIQVTHGDKQVTFDGACYSVNSVEVIEHPTKENTVVVDLQ